MAAPEKKIIAPWIAAAVMALLFVATLATVVGNLAAGYTEMAQYARQLEGYSYYPSFIDPQGSLLRSKRTGLQHWRLMRSGITQAAEKVIAVARGCA